MAAEALVMNCDERIERRPNVASGEAVIKGTRVTLRTVLASLAEGATTAEILEDFPTLTEQHVRIRERSSRWPAIVVPPTASSTTCRQMGRAS